MGMLTDKESREKDKKAREKIAVQLERNFFVEAGAGSGKTYCLVGRMANLIKKGMAKIDNIAAVTFTRKAAAELKERFQIRLEESLNEINITIDEKKNIQDAILNLEQIYIGTIHSFCAKILRERPVESNIDPDFEEIEEDKDFIYAEEAWSDFIDYANENGDSALKFMEENGIEIKDLKDTYHRFIQYPEVEAETAFVPEPDFSEVKNEINKFLIIYKDMLPQKAPEKSWDSLQSIIRKSSFFVSSGYLGSKRLFVRVLNEMCKTPEIVQNRWPGGNGKDCKEKILKLQDKFLKPALKSWQEYTHKPLVKFIKKGADFYRERRKLRSILNFGDLLTMTSDLLRDNSEVRKYFKRKFTHIFVDEFQDTDPIQAEIILFLTGRDTKETDWKIITPEDGALFLVGDPKQSIYRFRRADIDIYNTVKDIFSSECCEVLELYINRRSLSFMQELVESVFMKILPGEENEKDKDDKYQAKYSPLITDKGLEEGYDFGVFENNIVKTDNGKASDITSRDAVKISNWIYCSVNAGKLKLQRTPDEIKAGLTQKPDYSDFLILTKTRKSLGLYARALEKNGIPYDISGGLVFNESMELNEILKLFKAIDDDKDPVSLVAVLRGLFFGISDESLYNFKQAGGNFSYYSSAPAGFSDFEEAFKRLKEYKEIINKNEPVVAAEAIIEKSGIIPLALSEEEGLTRAGNIYKVMELLKDFDAEKIETFYDLTKNMEEILKNKEIESMSLLVSKKNVVRLMNLHKAKGLEASVVILADPMGESKHFEPQYHISRTEDKKAKGYFSISRPTSIYSGELLGIPPDWDDKLSEEKKYEEAERRRLEYVAVTRAKNILVVSTYREGTKAKAWEI
ncbi:MAG: UvrD-helicase domain-containing protein, partial [Candidatus Humimicrobiaceae bacterium]